jgi:hypothetical protein
MSDRDELAEIIQDCGEYIPGSHADDYVSPDKAADAILAAGYRKPRTVTTAEELDALPEDSVVMESEHDTFIIRTMRGVFHRFPDGWYVVAGHGAREYIQLPATVLFTPEPQS